MKGIRMKAALELIAQRDVPDNVNLWARIAERVERKNFMQTIRTRPVLALFLVLLALALISSVAYAIGKVTGYIPGVGLVNQSASLRMLAEPVRVKQKGLRVTIQKLVTNVDRTFVAYRVDGISPSTTGFPMCGEMPSLQLPDGSTLSFLSGGGGSLGGEMGSLRFETTAYYPPIPANVDHVIFTFPCILPKGGGPKNWQIPLDLVAAPEDFATPAFEVGATFVVSNPTFITTPTATYEFTPEPYDPFFPSTPTPVPNGSGLYLERAIELPHSYILVGNFTDVGDLPGHVQSTGSMYDYLPRIVDADEDSVQYKVREDIQPEINWGGVYYWAYEIAKPVHAPLKIILDQVDISTSSTVRFDFDTDLNPQPRQTWQLDLPIHLGRYDYVIDSVEMIKDGYLFKFHSGTDVPEGTSFILDIVASSAERGTTAGEEDRRPKDRVKYSQNITYLVPPPTGKLTVELTLFETVPLHGPWTLTWTPPTK